MVLHNHNCGKIDITIIIMKNKSHNHILLHPYNSTCSNWLLLLCNRSMPMAIAYRVKLIAFLLVMIQCVYCMFSEKVWYDSSITRVWEVVYPSISSDANLYLITSNVNVLNLNHCGSISYWNDGSIASPTKQLHTLNNLVYAVYIYYVKLKNHLSIHPLFVDGQYFVCICMDHRQTCLKCLPHLLVSWNLFWKVSDIFAFSTRVCNRYLCQLVL